MDESVNSEECADDRDEYSTCLIIECKQDSRSRRGLPSRR